eukprot:2879176-Amphidinium_carterae.1
MKTAHNDCNIDRHGKACVPSDDFKKRRWLQLALLAPMPSKLHCHQVVLAFSHAKANQISKIVDAKIDSQGLEFCAERKKMCESQVLPIEQHFQRAASQTHQIFCNH